ISNPGTRHSLARCAFRILPNLCKTCGAIESVKVAGTAAYCHASPAAAYPQLLGHALFGAGRESDFVIPPARGRRAPVRVTPRYRRRGACKTGRQGKHKSQIYNILRMMGQTANRPGKGSWILLKSQIF